ncbi:MAG TPA: PspC domain-containing protein [Candidatus Anaerobutyricum stercoripullorum]|uniref:PspC domain-containing protein n=1 Tax=Candidatus Anaerobutyricum stercoripullorum TaxID=2838456 RepID=A0A9D1X4K0_9FIRM|nr:PspC domain-containing protein [Candidatus Anaerobutyricum stercoripullorum]
MERKLYKSSQDKMLTGVCGGVAEYFGIDSTIVRLVMAFLTLWGIVPGIIIYIIAALVIPNDPRY